MLSAKRAPAFTVAQPSDFTASGVIDHTLDVRRLRKNLSMLVRTSRYVVFSGDPRVVENIAAQRGWRTDELVILPVRGFGQEFHLVSATISRWRKDYYRLLDLKHEALESGEKVVLVPPSYIQREPRLGNARLVADVLHVSPTSEDRMSVFLHLVENGGYSTLHDCAMAVVNCESPYSCILRMAAMGLLDIDLDKPITPHARVNLPDQR